jgi:hypothetical protein
MMTLTLLDSYDARHKLRPRSQESCRGMMFDVCTTITLSQRVIHEIKRLDSEVMLLRHKLQDLEAKSPTEERWFDC